MTQNDKILEIFLSSSLKYLTFLRQSEIKLLNMYLFSSPLLISLIIGMINYLKNNMLINLMVLYWLILYDLFAIFFTFKIKRLHYVYETIGESITKIFEYYKLFKKGVYIENESILNTKSKFLGKGTGYLKTLYILWIVTIMTNFLLLFLLIKNIWNK